MCKYCTVEPFEPSKRLKEQARERKKCVVCNIYTHCGFGDVVMSFTLVRESGFCTNLHSRQRHRKKVHTLYHSTSVKIVCYFVMRKKMWQTSKPMNTQAERGGTSTMNARCVHFKESLLTQQL